MKTKNYGPTAVVTAYLAPTRHQPTGRVQVSCPHCVQIDRWRRPTDTPGTHMHGIGAAGQRPDLGDRVAHCVDIVGREYEITDPNGLVPTVLVIEAATA